MAVLFALLVVAVIGSAVLVALKWPQTGQLPAPPTDRPPTMVPDGPLTGADLASVRFPVVVRGYRMEDVDALLDRLGAQLDQAVDQPPERSGHPQLTEEPPREAPPA
ncbi:MAG: DivIVA domain-containing protein [Actinobacteria bacterium]|nr:DivIVA domain-containing protein [Actinomycetota bacterium]